MSELKDLNERLTTIIIGTCNTIGCKDCGLKWDDTCSATDLQNKIDVIEYDDFKSKLDKQAQ